MPTIREDICTKQNGIESEPQWGQCLSSAVVSTKCKLASYIEIVIRKACATLDQSNYQSAFRYLAPMLSLPRTRRPESSPKLPSVFSLPRCSYLLRICTWTQSRRYSNDVSCINFSEIPMAAQNTSCRQSVRLLDILK